jgi:hypothetical protein
MNIYEYREIYKLYEKYGFKRMYDDADDEHFWMCRKSN